MAVLSLNFRLDELSQEGRPFKGDLKQENVAEAVAGLVGKLGYRALGPLEAQGTVYRSPGGEVIVDAKFTIDLGFDCVRCLEARALGVTRRADHVLVAAKGERDDEDVEDDDDPDVYRFVGDKVDLGELFREDLVLELPMNPTCADAGEACVEQELDASAQEATVDPRWASLLEMKKKLEPSS